MFASGTKSHPAQYDPACHRSESQLSLLHGWYIRYRNSQNLIFSALSTSSGAWSWSDRTNGTPPHAQCDLSAAGIGAVRAPSGKSARPRGLRRCGSKGAHIVFRQVGRILGFG